MSASTPAPAAFTEEWLTAPAGTPFYTRTYSPPNGTPQRATLVFVHGFIEHVARYDHVFPTVAARGITVFCYDQRGFGRTAVEGKTKKGGEKSAYGKTSVSEQIGDLEWALVHARKHVAEEGVPLFLWGHSMGGMLSLSFTTQTTRKSDHVSLLHGAIASSPLIQLTNKTPRVLRLTLSTIGSIAPHTPVPSEVKGDALSHDKTVAQKYLSDPLVKQWGTARGVRDMLHLGDSLHGSVKVEWPKGVPLLVLHGTHDQVTSCAASQSFFEKVPADKKTFVPFEGGYHELQNEPEFQDKFVEEIITFIETHSQPTPESVDPAASTGPEPTQAGSARPYSVDLPGGIPASPSPKL